MDQGKKQQLITGLVLIALGGLFYLLQTTENIGAAAIFLIVGSAFMASYFYTKQYGLLIPACIMLGMGLGQLDLFGFRGSKMIGLGAGFVAIYFIALLYERRSQWWPLIPGSILMLVGLRVSTTTILIYLRNNWPLALVALVVVIVISALLGRGRARSS